MARTPEDFVAHYRKVTVNEKAAVQSHFNDLCELLGVPKPLDHDPSGTEYRFEKHVSKVTGKKGYADVWWRGRFGWEYKGVGADLKKAYQQLLSYREDLENPPLQVVSDMHTIEVHTNFTGTQKVTRVWKLEDLLNEGRRADLRKVWTEPQFFNPSRVIEQATVAAVADLAKISGALKDRGENPDRVAHFLVRTMFTLFAEDVDLIPEGTFTRLLTQAARNAPDFQPMCEELFAAMKVGRVTLAGRIPHINGGVFEDTSAPALSRAEIVLLRDAALRSWRQIDPTIFGTLFETVINPDKRWQLGAHYTPLADILDIVEPVVMRPLRAEWETLRAELAPVVVEIENARTHGGNLYTPGGLGQGQVDGAVALLTAFQNRLAAVTVMDPAMGSGNFLYVTLRLLLDLEAEVRATIRGLTANVAPQPRVSPRQLLGMEVNPYAHEIAGMVLWIGYLQWLREHGEQWPYKQGEEPKTPPVLDKLPGLRLTDGVMELDATGQTTGNVATWPAAEFIVGNPPFLGYSPMREQLGGEYVDRLRKAYEGRIPGFSDFVCFFFEKARENVADGKTRRVGLIATNSIAGGENARVLERILETGSIFRAWPDRAWIQSGAAVRTAVVMFDDGSDPERLLLRHEGDERKTETRQTVETPVARINADLS
ncbi:DNA methyltransferase, partial [Deinococcus frigens]